MKKIPLYLTFLLANVVALAVVSPASYKADEMLDLLKAEAKRENIREEPTFTKLNDGTKATRGAIGTFLVDAVGDYEIRFRYARRENRYDNIQIRVVRESDGATVAFRFIEYKSNMRAAPSSPKYPERAAEDIDASVAVSLESIGKYTIYITGAYGAYVEGNRNWNSTASKPAISTLSLVKVNNATSSRGFVPATFHLPNAKLNSALPIDDRLQLCVHECYPFYNDLSYLLDLGINMHLQGYDATKNFQERDVKTTANVGFEGANPAFAKQYPGHIGKYANEHGEYNDSMFSYSFEPYRQHCYERAVRDTKKIVNEKLDYNAAILNWYSAWEQCGMYDYGEASVDKFRNVYLKEKYGTIEALNKAWHQNFTSFNDVVPAVYKDCVGKRRLTDDLALYQARASYLDFRDFCSKEYATFLGLKTKAIQENDPQKRNMTSAYSNNNLGSICWLKWRPLSFEDAMRYTLTGSKTMGWDIYGTDDLIAEAYEHWFSFGNEKCHPMIKEANIHALGGELTARSFWNLLGEGMRGMAFFTAQESPKAELRKFGLSNVDDDMAPRPKAAAVSDLFRAAQHIEPFMAYGERHAVGKPVAIFYDQNCNVMQERGYGSMFDCAPDSHMRLFEIIRSCGYPCTIVTARQILEENKLDKVSAVFFCDAQYLAPELIDALDAWTKKGGHVVMDGQCGVYDDHGFPTDKCINFLGIKPIVRQRVDESKTAALLAEGYSNKAFDAVNPDELWLTMREYLHQRDSQHPVAKAAGKFMFSGFGAQDVKSLKGEMIVLGNNEEVGWNIYQNGKGSVSYFGGYLGTLYGAGCTQYEWRDAHADSSVHRFFTALLDYFGTKKNADVQLEESTSLRISNPLVDAQGNMLSSITSFADHTLPAFKCRTYLPKDVKPPKAVYFTKEGSRKVEKLNFKYDHEKHAIVCTVPSFRVFGNLLLVQNQKYPLVSVDMGECSRDCYRLPDMRPGEEREIRVRVYNTTANALESGKLKLRLPEGWFSKGEEVSVPALPAFGASREFTFVIKAPAVCASRRLKPINFVYESGTTTSTPAVEMVWFQKEPQEANSDF